MRHSIVFETCWGRLRPLATEDLPLTMAWRNHDRVRSMFMTMAEISAGSHREWFERYERTENDYVFVADDASGVPVGQVSLYHVDRKARSGEFGRLIVDPARMGEGWGHRITWAAIQVACYRLDLGELRLDVRTGNRRAIRVYLASGFEIVDVNPEVVTMRLLAPANPSWDGDGVADKISSYWKTTDVAWRPLLAAKVGRSLGSSTCEVGCGSGLVAEALRDSGWKGQYLGVDTSFAMLGIAHSSRGWCGRFQFGDGNRLPLASGDVSSAVSFEVFGHLADFERPLREMMRVARDTVFFTCWIGPPREHVELWEGQRFLHKVRSEESVRELVDRVSRGAGCEVERLYGENVLFTIRKS